VVVALAAAIVGTIAAVHYHQRGLTLSHYDARGHLVVARRIIDSITPGWQQVGAVWLPLPHLLNMLPVQIDAFYRSGASAVGLSIVAFALASGSIAAIVSALTGSAIAAVAAAGVFVLNPNVLYLQATPMTEPLLMALTTLGVAMLVAGDARLQPRATNEDGPVARGASRAIGCVFALACLTRYEAWPVTGVALVAAGWTLWRAGEPWSAIRRDVSTMARYPAVAIVAFAIFSRVVIGDWFVAAGFFVPENKAIGDLTLAAAEIGWGVRALSSAALVAIGAAGTVILAVLGTFERRRASAVAVLALAATAVIPLAAFYRGHPFRIRYMVPLLALEAIGAGVAAGFVRKLRIPGGIAVMALTAVTLRPVDAAAPMVVEAQWDRPNVAARAAVTRCLGAPQPGMKIMASMGSLGHYMQEASRWGYQLRDFLHEGNGDIWLAAIDAPRPFAQWILIEEKAEGGDALARIAREHPHFLDGYSRVCEGAGLALYRRTESSSAQ
jgi:hypothetical protein